MKTLAAHVGKDLRDQRATLLVLAAFLVLLGTVIGATLPANAVQDGALIPWMLLAGGALGALALAADFVPSEGARGTLPLLTRLPRGLALAFTSKALLVAGSALAFAALGALVAYLGWHLRFAGSHTLDLPVLEIGTGALAVLALGWWVLALSCWMPRGLPAVLGVAVLALPHALALAWAGRISRFGAAYDWIVATDGTMSLLAHLLAGPCVAAASLVLGRRWSDGTWGSLRVGLPVACLTLLPAWGMLAWRTAKWCLPPSLAEGLANLDASECSTTRDGKTLFARLAWRPGFPTHVFAIDLESGALRKVFPRDHWVVDWAHRFRAFSNASSHPLRLGRFALDLDSRSDDSTTLLATDTLTEVARLDASPLSAELRAALRSELAESSELLLADSRRGWVFDGRFEIQGAGGAIHELAWDPRWRLGWPRGLGFTVQRDLGNRTETGLFDLQRERVFWLGESTWDTTALGDMWLERRRLPQRLPEYAESWWLVDPDRGRRTILPAVDGHFAILAVLEDGRVLVRKRLSPFGALQYSLVDLRDGRFAWTAIPCPWNVGKVDLGFLASGVPNVVRDPEEAVVLHGPDHVAGCFPYALRCGPVVPGTWLGRLSAHDVLVRRDAELWRCDLRDGALTRLHVH